MNIDDSGYRGEIFKFIEENKLDIIEYLNTNITKKSIPYWDDNYTFDIHQNEYSKRLTILTYKLSEQLLYQDGKSYGYRPHCIFSNDEIEIIDDSYWTPDANKNKNTYEYIVEYFLSEKRAKKIEGIYE